MPSLDTYLLIYYIVTAVEKIIVCPIILILNLNEVKK
ncbi:MAG: hypothetical protein TIS_01846 [Tissierella sp.]